MKNSEKKLLLEQLQNALALTDTIMDEDTLDEVDEALAHAIRFVKSEIKP
jgi:hypothetical protein